jgi:hypothetical protein
MWFGAFRDINAFESWVSHRTELPKETIATRPRVGDAGRPAARTGIDEPGAAGRRTGGSTVIDET